MTCSMSNWSIYRALDGEPAWSGLSSAGVAGTRTVKSSPLSNLMTASPPNALGSLIGQVVGRHFRLVITAGR